MMMYKIIWSIHIGNGLSIFDLPSFPWELWHSTYFDGGRLGYTWLFVIYWYIFTYMCGFWGYIVHLAPSSSLFIGALGIGDTFKQYFDDFIELYLTHVDVVGYLHYMRWLHYMCEPMLLSCHIYKWSLLSLTSSRGCLSHGVCTWSPICLSASFGGHLENTFVDMWRIFTPFFMVIFCLHKFGGGLGGQTLDSKFIFHIWSLTHGDIS